MHAIEFVESYFDAWNSRDPQAVADHLAADGIYRDIPQSVQRTHDELIVSLNDFFSNYRHRYELIGNILTSSNTVAFQYRMCPPRKVRKGESDGSFRGAEFVTLYGDAAISIYDYYDTPEAARPAHLARLSSQQAESAKYAKSGLSSAQLFQYKSRLNQLMRSQHAYLQPDLTLPKLAQAVDCSVNHLSQVINSGFGMSLFEYLNQFRIRHAQDLLSNVDSHADTVLKIAFTVGFNSNSAFYAAFKKCVGQSPAQYRRSQLKKAH